MYRESDFTTSGNFTQKPKKSMVGVTIEEAAYSLVKTILRDVLSITTQKVPVKLDSAPTSKI